MLADDGEGVAVGAWMPPPFASKLPGCCMLLLSSAGLQLRQRGGCLAGLASGLRW